MSDDATEAAPPRLELIVAMAANRVIGRGGQLPWRLPDDLKHFKQLTTGHPIIMGRRTYESIGKPLPGRRNIVISKTLAQPPSTGVELARSVDDALTIVAAASASRAFIIGGAVLYAAALPRVQVMHVTELDEAVDGDTFFPPVDRSQWRLRDDIRHERDDRHAFAFSFRTYVRL
ncbi:MAG: dihydrofolate reductase [Phycisphaerales bacterium]|nr:dihydrofolate reductase [Phycisphaerales bacterium]